MQLMVHSREIGEANCSVYSEVTFADIIQMHLSEFQSKYWYEGKPVTTRFHALGPESELVLVIVLYRQDDKQVVAIDDNFVANLCNNEGKTIKTLVVSRDHDWDIKPNQKLKNATKRHMD